MGQIREDYGIKNFSYGKFAGSADARYGINDWLTAEGRVELSDSIQLAGLGSVLKLNQFGVLSGSATQSWADREFNRINSQNMKGNQYTLGYSYNQQRFGFSLNHTQRDQDYYDLSRLQYSNLISANSHKSSVANTYFATDKSGTFGVAYIQTKNRDIKNKLMNLSWAPYYLLSAWCDSVVKCQSGFYRKRLECCISVVGSFFQKQIHSQFRL